MFFDSFDHWRIKEANWKSSRLLDEVFISLLFWSFCWRLGDVIFSLLLLNYGFVTFVWNSGAFGTGNVWNTGVVACWWKLNNWKVYTYYCEFGIEIEIEDILFVWCVLWWILNLIFLLALWCQSNYTANILMITNYILLL
jgi:hypothetical protein